MVSPVLCYTAASQMLSQVLYYIKSDPESNTFSNDRREKTAKNQLPLRERNELGDDNISMFASALLSTVQESLIKTSHMYPRF